MTVVPWQHDIKTGGALALWGPSPEGFTRWTPYRLGFDPCGIWMKDPLGNTIPPSGVSSHESSRVCRVGCGVPVDLDTVAGRNMGGEGFADPGTAARSGVWEWPAPGGRLAVHHSDLEQSRELECRVIHTAAERDP